jgi:hypothetical protein
MPRHDDDAYCKHRVFPAVTCEICYPKPVITDDEARKLTEECLDGEPAHDEFWRDAADKLAHKVIELLDRQRWIPLKVESYEQIAAYSHVNTYTVVKMRTTDASYFILTLPPSHPHRSSQRKNAPATNQDQGTCQDAQ